MKKAIIINKISDIPFLLNNKAFKNSLKDYYLFTSHASVEFFLDYKYGIKCDCLSKYISREKTADNLKKADKFAIELTDALDSKYSEGLNSQSGFKNIRFFKSLYAYLIYLRFNSFVNFIQSLSTVISEKGIKDVFFYDHSLSRFFASSTTLKDLLDSIKTDTVFKEIKKDVPVDAGSMEFIPLYKRNAPVKGQKESVLKKIIGFLKRSSRTFINLVKKIKGKKKPYILLYDSLYDLVFLHGGSKYNIIRYDTGTEMKGALPAGFKKSLKTKKKFNLSLDDLSLDYDSRYPELKDLLLKDIKEDFNSKINNLLVYLKSFEDINKKVKVKLGVWGNPPTYGFKALLFEYLLADNIPVLGCEHGGLAGNHFNHDVYIADMTRCTHYITYGYGKDDLKITYPEKDFNLPVYSFGSARIANIVKQSKENKQKKKVDILYPIVNTFCMLDGGMIREKPDEINEKKIKLLKYLESLENVSVMIKPFPNASYETLSVLPMLEDLKKVEVIYNVPFGQVLAEYDQGCVIIDHPTTSLYEVSGLNTDIFVINENVVRTIEKGAVSDLTKRTYYFEDIDKTIENLDLFIKGKLDKKRDNTFYNRFVAREKTKENIENLVESLVFGKDKV
ncbi:MAG: hypothetical protein ABIH00_00865 [Armatimonadota bacterium]